jgi:hypothetical protein
LNDWNIQMSMEIYVLSQRPLGSIGGWQNAIDELSFPIQFEPGAEFHKLSGFLPLRLHGKLSGFECDHWTVEDIRETYKEISFDPKYVYALAFRWGSNFNELASAWQAAAAYATATGGVVFDCQESELYSATKAVEIAREIEASLPELEISLQKAPNEFNSK